jgi:hypothetical protein
MAESEGDRDTTLRRIVQADAESLVRPWKWTRTTERLGEGLRSTRCWSTTDDQLVATHPRRPVCVTHLGTIRTQHRQCMSRNVLNCPHF